VKKESKASVPERLRDAGGLKPGTPRELARDTGVAEAEVHGVGSIYHLLARPEPPVRVCTGLGF
jgi:hypothetical protein